MKTLEGLKKLMVSNLFYNKITEKFQHKKCKNCIHFWKIDNGAYCTHLKNKDINQEIENFDFCSYYRKY